MTQTSARRNRPRSPNMQIYRPQLTSVLSLVNRLTGVLLGACAIVLVIWLVIWLVAGAAGSQAYALVHAVIASPIGRIVLFCCTFAFFMHLCGGLRHLAWDSVRGFELRTIYISCWTVVAVSIVLTVAAWIASAYTGA